MKHVQFVIGTLFYYAQAIEPAILPALHMITSLQSQPTQKTMNNCNQNMYYVATYPNAYIRFRCSEMILMLDNDSTYIVIPKSQRRTA